MLSPKKYAVAFCLRSGYERSRATNRPEPISTLRTCALPPPRRPSKIVNVLPPPPGVILFCPRMRMRMLALALLLCKAAVGALCRSPIQPVKCFSGWTTRPGPGVSVAVAMAVCPSGSTQHTHSRISKLITAVYKVNRQDTHTTQATPKLTPFWVECTQYKPPILDWLYCCG